MKSKGRKGKTHPLQDIIQEVRKVFIDMGFDEVENQIFIPEGDVYKQYGSEAPVILDRCYYLAGLPRPDIGLGKKQIAAIENIHPGFDFDEFKKILRGYREGSVEGDDLAEEMVNRLGIGMDEALRIIDLIPEFRSITPIPSRITLRSHMTAAWFPTLQAMQDTHELPLRLFSIGLRFRREQRVDSTHLRVHYGASCVVMDDRFDIDDGKKLSGKILGDLGFRNIRFERKKATSNYYEKDTEFEIYSNDLEIADCGMYSRVSLSNYDIGHPVFNLGFGLERILMIRSRKEDIREILYPQFYKPLELSDEEIARQVKINIKPKTEEGKELVKLLVREAKRYSDERSPCRFRVYSGKLLGRKVDIDLVEREKNTKLLGPAALNEIYVYDGNIYGVPSDVGKLAKKLIGVKERGIKVDFSYIDAVMNLFVADVENLIMGEDKAMGETSAAVVSYAPDGKIRGYMQIKMAKTPADLNIKIGSIVRRFITSKNKKIYIRGPVFTALEVIVD